MKKIRALLIAVFILGPGGVGTGFAEESKIHAWTVGPRISFIEYEEPDVMKERGPMFGLAGSYTYRQDFMFKAEGELSYGKVDYSSPSSGDINGIDDYLMEIRALGGYAWKISDKLTITPFLGIGYRYLRDDTAGKVSTTGARGYLRESNYYYSPLGAEFLVLLENGWSVSTTLEYDYFWRGKQKSRLSDASSTFGDLENTQHSGYGWRASVGFRKKIQAREYSLVPFVKYWSIDRSDVQNFTHAGVLIGYGYEPRNTSKEIGIAFMMGF